MSATLLMLVLAAPPGECDWMFSKKPQPSPAKSTFTPAIGEGRIPPAGVVAPVGASTCGNPLCPCGQCACRNCCCGLSREAMQSRARQFGVAESVTLPPVPTATVQQVYQQPRYQAPAVYYQPAPVQRYQTAPSFAIPYAAPPASGCPGGVCPAAG